MPGLKSRYLLPILLVLTTVLVDLIWMVAEVYLSPGSLLEMVWVGLALGQTAALAGWLAMGRWCLLLRLIVVLGVAGLLAAVIAEWLGAAATEVMGVQSLFGATIALPAAAVRLVGFGLVRRTDGAHFGSCELDCEHRFRNTPAGLGTWQFSLATLFSWTTCAALLLGVMPWLDFPWDAVAAYVYFIGFGAIAGSVFWILLRGKRLLLRTVIAGLVAIPASHVLAVATGAPGGFSAFGFSMTSYCIAVGVVLKIAGYRIERSSKRDNVDAQPDADATAGTGEDECPV